MRRVLIDHARSKGYQKRGGGVVKVTFDEFQLPGIEPDPDVVALDDALDALSGADDRKAQVVELRFFGGLSVEETAAVLNISPETVKRDWKFAKAWLSRELTKTR
jgi:RNA polymerase sigma factor (TIGR02999 family)